MTARVNPGTVLSVHDGDSCLIELNLGFGVGFRCDVRLAGINARELALPGGREAAAHLAGLLPVGAPVTVTALGPDKYGMRWDCRVVTAAGVDVARQMVDDGFAAVWDGKGPKPVPAWPMGGP